ncbi:BRO family protein [Pelistega sp. MC2]|uniref:BRO family protein n=1 Tax=Pelistega sp. MC2 TaxID=1720297 RepID=UPI0008DAAD01|nr:BRO family protein [Pelistega sp. MC2]
MQALTFNQTSFDIIDQDNQIWVKSAQLAQALGYSDERSVSKIYTRNQDEFTDKMAQVVKLTTSGNYQTTTRIFSLRGAHLIAMFARTEVAKEFRKWVLDVLENHTQETQPSPQQITYTTPMRNISVSVEDILDLASLQKMAFNMSETLALLEKPLRAIGSNNYAAHCYDARVHYKVNMEIFYDIVARMFLAADITPGDFHTAAEAIHAREFRKELEKRLKEDDQWRATLNPSDPLKLGTGKTTQGVLVVV